MNTFEDRQNLSGKDLKGNKILWISSICVLSRLLSKMERCGVCL